MANASFSASQALEEYIGTDLPHIERIMTALSKICPPMVYPYVGSFDDPRLPFQAGEWTLGSTTAPDGGKQAELTDAATHGHYYIGDQWPSTDMAPQAILWVPPRFPDARYVGSPDRMGNGRYTSEADEDVLYPDQPTVLTSESPQSRGVFSYRRIGAVISPWTVQIWGNSWRDTKLLAMWLASAAHDVERSQAERTGATFTATRGGWYPDKPGDRGVVWAMTIEISEPIVRSDFTLAIPIRQTGTKTFDINTRFTPGDGQSSDDEG